MTGAQPYDEGDARILAGEYALGLLTPDEAAAFEARLTVEPELRALYAAWSEDFTTMTDAIAPVDPPAALYGRIEAQLFGRVSLWGTLAGWRGFAWLAGGAVAAALVLFVMLGEGLLEQGPAPQGVPAYTAQISGEDGAMLLVASYDAEAGTLDVERRNGVVPEGRVLELWLIAGENAPVSLGVLPESGTARFDVAAALRAQLPGGVLAITAEPPGGSPTGDPTGGVLATGEVTPT